MQCPVEYHGKKQARMSGKVAMWQFPLLRLIKGPNDMLCHVDIMLKNSSI